MSYLYSFLVTIGITVIYFLLKKNDLNISDVNAADLFICFVGTFLAVFGLINFAFNTAKKRIIKSRSYYFNNTRKIKKVDYIDTETNKIISTDYFNESGKRFKTIKYN